MIIFALPNSISIIKLKLDTSEGIIEMECLKEKYFINF